MQALRYLEHILIYIPLLVFARNCKFLVQRVAAFFPFHCTLPPLLSPRTCTNVCFVNFETSRRRLLSLSLSSTVSLSHNLLSHNHTLSLSFSFWLALFIALLVLFIASRTGHTRGNSSSSVSNLPRLSNRTLEGGYPRATCGEAHQVSSRRQRPKPPFPPHSECNSICLFFLCTAEAYRISCIT